jgi:hypothetical protein
MAEDQKNAQNEFQGCCGEMPFRDMMKKMMESKKSGSPFDCAQMMSQMKAMCCGAAEKKEGPAPETKENPTSKQ